LVPYGQIVFVIIDLVFAAFTAFAGARQTGQPDDRTVVLIASGSLVGM
jgi:hypothetical protein